MSSGTGVASLDNPILNGPYDEPSRHWMLDEHGQLTADIAPRRRPSDTWVPVPPQRKGRSEQGVLAVQDELDVSRTGERREVNDQINALRAEVRSWRARGYPGATATTRRLLLHWADPQRENRVFFAQREAVETAVYVAEVAGRASVAEAGRSTLATGSRWVVDALGKQNAEYNAGLPRIGLKMATGTGKTVVMAMLIAWQTLNKAANRSDPRFTNRFLVVTPGITIRDRLRVLYPSDAGSYYRERDLVPADLWPDLMQARIAVTNYHAFMLRTRHDGQGVAANTKKLLTARTGRDPFLETEAQMVARVLRDIGGVARNSLAYVRYADDFGLQAFTNFWTDTGTGNFTDDKIYVVQTATKVIERCILMTTDPGDLVLDPTCGSGTTAYVAEQWGRRWITIDTSRVAIALARQRIMGARYPYYLLADSPEGQAKERELGGGAGSIGARHRYDLRQGFVYERVPHITLKSIANNPDIHEGMSRAEIDAAIRRHADVELLYDRPYEDKKRVRVSGRFTVESLSPHRSVSFDGAFPGGEHEPVAPSETLGGAGYETTILDNLRTAGVQNGRRQERMLFTAVDPHPGRFVQALGSVASQADVDAARELGAHVEPVTQRVAICLGPEYGTVDSRLIKAAAREALAMTDVEQLLVLGYAFDANALGAAGETEREGFASVADERRLGRLSVLLVRMNADLAMGDELLKNSKAANLFTVFGEPDVDVRVTADGVVVEIRGVDVYDPTTGDVRSDGVDGIALWMIDTDYDEEQFLVRHVYFSGSQDPYKKLKTSLKAEIDPDAWQSLYGTVSRPFPRPTTGKIAIKAINYYGDEVLVVREVP